MQSTEGQPLEGVRVLDLSRILAGPWAAQTLADLGAEVIKVERPEVGDDTRHWGPPYQKDADGNDTENAAYFASANRGKKSIAVDFTQPEGQEIVRRIARHSDVLIENFKLGGLAKYGLDYDSLRQINPGLVYCSITGFGQTGPYAARAGYDFLVQGMGGLMSVTGEADGQPMKIGVALTDILTGLYSTIAIQAALAQRQKTGEGQHIDMALLDVTTATMANQAMNYLVSGEAPGRLGNAHPNIVPYQAFASADGHIILAIGNHAQFTRFCEVAGRPELAADPRFASNRVRVENRETLVAILAKIIAERTTDDWIAALEAVKVPCGPINTLDRVFADPQVQARGLRRELEHPMTGSVPSVANPIRMSGASLTSPLAPPTLGQHTDEVLAQFAELAHND